MDKCDARGMEHKPLIQCTIKGIANYGAIETILVSSMDTQLMCAARDGFKADDSA